MDEIKKVALITGGSRGIGKEIAKKFASNNYNLVINYVSDNTDLEGLKKEFENTEVLFVKVVDKVKKGQTLCIIEAMKLMNEIEAECDGEIVEICATDDSMVEFGQSLFKIK